MNEDELKKKLMETYSPRGEYVSIHFYIISEYDNKERELDCYLTIEKDSSYSEECVDKFLEDSYKYLHDHWKVIDEKGFTFHNYRCGIFDGAVYGDKFRCRDYERPAIYLGSNTIESDSNDRYNVTHLLLVPSRLRGEEYKLYKFQSDYGCNDMSIEIFEDDGKACTGNYWGSIDIIGKYDEFVK